MSALLPTSMSAWKRCDNSPMALLQISEPGGAPDPHQRRIAVGIDLGTTHSLVAAVRNGVAECLPKLLEATRQIFPTAERIQVYLEDDPEIADDWHIMIDVTVRGLGGADHPHPLQTAFIELGAAQCGICIPGMLVSLYAFLEAQPRATRQEVREAIGGNLCRCTGYHKIVDAAEAAARHLVSLEPRS